MAARHQLALDVLDTANPLILKLSDASIYSTLLPVDCPRLDITLPGFLSPSYVSSGLPQGFVRVLTAAELGLQRLRDQAPHALPDGVYRLRYSVAPNERTGVEYYHLRLTSFLNDYYAALCRVQLAECALSGEQSQRLRELREIFTYAQAAKAQAEYCQAPEQGTQLLAYARLLLTNFQAGSCPGCR